MSDISEESVDTVAGFPQDGQPDRVALSNSVFSTTFEVLQHFADAGIQPMIYQASLAIAEQFRLGENGSRQIRDAMSNLRVSHGFESALRFGFGQESFLSLLKKHNFGLQCATLCASLREVYGVIRGSQLLQALWKSCEFPEDSQPFSSQFVALLSNCSGLFFFDTFSQCYETNGRTIQIWILYDAHWNLCSLAGSIKCNSRTISNLKFQEEF